MIYCGRVAWRKDIWLITRALVDDGVEVQHILHSRELIHTTPNEFSSTPDQWALFSLPRLDPSPG